MLAQPSRGIRSTAGNMDTQSCNFTSPRHQSLVHVKYRKKYARKILPFLYLWIQKKGGSRILSCGNTAFTKVENLVYEWKIIDNKLVVSNFKNKKVILELNLELFSKLSKLDIELETE